MSEVAYQSGSADRAWLDRLPHAPARYAAGVLGLAGLYYASYDEFQEALALLESRPELRARMGRRGRAYYDAHYAWEVIERKYLTLLEPLRPVPSRRTA